MAQKSPTDQEVEQAEKAVIKLYVKAQKEIRKMIQEYFDQFADEDEKKQSQMEKGEITKAEYKDWRRRTMCEGKTYEKFRDKLARKYLDINRKAMDEINSEEKQAFMTGVNYNLYKFETGMK